MYMRRLESTYLEKDGYLYNMYVIKKNYYGPLSTHKILCTESLRKGYNGIGYMCSYALPEQNHSRNLTNIIILCLEQKL